MPSSSARAGAASRREDALDHVWGYTIVNDVTARDLQGRYSQWLIGKSQDTFCPMGPWAVTKDEIDLPTAGIRCFVNGDLRQNSKIALLIFDIPTIIATISAGHHAAARRHHRHRHAGRRRHRLRSAEISQGRRRRARRDRRHRRAGEPVRGACANDHRRRSARWSRRSRRGPPVVMIHGLGGTSNMFQPQMAALCAAIASSASTCRAPAARRGRSSR